MKIAHFIQLNQIKHQKTSFAVFQEETDGTFKSCGKSSSSAVKYVARCDVRSFLAAMLIDRINIEQLLYTVA